MLQGTSRNSSMSNAPHISNTLKRSHTDTPQTPGARQHRRLSGEAHGCDQNYQDACCHVGPLQKGSRRLYKGLPQSEQYPTLPKRRQKEKARCGLVARQVEAQSEGHPWQTGLESAEKPIRRRGLGEIDSRHQRLEAEQLRERSVMGTPQPKGLR